MDTAYHNSPAPEFAATGRRIVIGENPSTSHRWTFVYIPSEAAQEWDGVKAPHAIGSRFGFYCYAEIKVTGRADRFIGGEVFRKARIRTNIGTEDEAWSDCWIVGGGECVS